MNFFIISLSLILFSGYYISGLDIDSLKSIDVLATLHIKVPDCKLRDFVKTDKDLDKLTEDLSTYCSTSQTSKQYYLICRMVAYELKKACGLSPNSRPSPAIYSLNAITSDEICNKKNIAMTSDWILKKITNNGEKKIGVNADELCLKVASDKDTFRLARFFYKIAPNVRKNDLTKQNKDNAQSNTNDKSLKESVVETGKNVKDNVVDQVQAVKEQTKDVVDTVTNKTKDVVDKIKDKAKELVEGAKTGLDAAVDTVKDTAKQVAQNVQDKTGQVVDAVKDTGKQAIDTVKDTAKQTAQNVQDKTGQVVDAVKDTGKQAIDTVKDTAKQTAQNVQDKTGQVVDAVKDTGKQAIDTVKDTAKQTAQDVQDKVGQGADVVKDTAKQTAQNVQDKTGQVVDAVKDTGKQAIDTVKDTAKQTAQDAQDKVGQGVDAVKDTAKQTAQNVQDKTGQVVDAVKDTGKQAIDAVKDTTKQTTPGVQGKVTQGVDAGKKVVEGAEDKTDQVAEKAKVAGDQNVVSETTTKTGGVTQSSIDKPKQVVEGAKLFSNVTKELSGDKQQQVLDLNKNEKPETENKKDQANPKENYDDDDDDQGEKNKEQPKVTQAIQIQKLDLSQTKDEQKVDEQKPDTKTPTPPLIPENKNKEPKVDGDDNEGDRDQYDERPRDQLREEQDPLDKKKDSPSQQKPGDDATISKTGENVDDGSDEQIETGNQLNNNENIDNQAEDNKVDAIKIRKPNEQDRIGKTPDKDLKLPVFQPPPSVPKQKLPRKYNDDEGWSGNFVTYFLLFTLFVVVGYLVLHNKNKVLGLLIEGCRRDRSAHGRRAGGSTNSARYQRLSQSS